MKSPRLWLKHVVNTGAEWLARNGFYGLAEKWGGYGQTWSGKSVTDQSALNHSVVWACVRIISESVAFMPLNMMRDVRGEKNPAKAHPLYSALHNAPNDEMTTMSFRETLTGHLVMGGNCYAQIIRRSGTDEAFQLWPLMPESVKPDHEKKGKGRLVYVVKDGNAAEKTYTVKPGEPQDILHISGLGHDGTCGYGVIAMARHSIGTALALEEYAGRFFSNGGRQSGHIEAAQKFKDTEDMKRARADLDKFTGNPDNIHKWPIFEPGLTFKPSSFSPQDSQFIETRQFTPADICRWFLISPHLVGDLSHATFSNIEHLALAFVKMTLTAWITRWEQNLWRCVLTPDEKAGGYYFKHNVNGLLRGDFASRMAGYSQMLQNGIDNIDEVRDLEDMNPLPGGIGKKHRVQLNMQIVGEPPPVLTSGQEESVKSAQLQELIVSLSQALTNMKSKEVIQ